MGSLLTILLLSNASSSHDPVKTVEEAEKKITAWMHVKNCAVATVKDIDLFERKVLVKARGIYFVMTAYGTETFEICPICKAKTADPR